MSRFAMGHQDRVSYNYEARIVAARVSLDQATWENAWAECRAMSAEHAVDRALEYGATPPERPPIPADYPVSLSAREVEVLRLVAQRLTSRKALREPPHRKHPPA